MTEIDRLSKTDHDFHRLTFKYAAVQALSNRELTEARFKLSRHKLYRINKYYVLRPLDIDLVQEAMEERVYTAT